MENRIYSYSCILRIQISLNYEVGEMIMDEEEWKEFKKWLEQEKNKN